MASTRITSVISIRSNLLLIPPANSLPCCCDWYSSDEHSTEFANGHVSVYTIVLQLLGCVRMEAFYEIRLVEDAIRGAKILVWHGSYMQQ
jgi:hypothetical protein